LIGVAGVAIALDNGTNRRTADRRLSIAIGVSLLVHALTIASLRGLLPTIYTFAPGGGSITALQAVLAAPISDIPPAEPTEPEPAIDPTLLLPPEANPLEPPLERPLPHVAPMPGGGAVTSGARSPEVSIAVGLIEDPGRLGPDYVVRLAQRFPDRAPKPPMLAGTTSVAYPPAALASGTERRVAVLLTLRADGSIAESQLIPDDPLFGPTVLEALKDARFTPAEIEGKPVPYWAIVEFVFLLGRPPAPAVAERAQARRGAAYPRQPKVGR
jgi:hypothetical protein